MVSWPAAIVVLLGLWVAGVPFFGPVLALSMRSMARPATGMMGMHGMAGAAASVVAVAGSTLWNHTCQAY
jgi:hypothetical protein